MKIFQPAKLLPVDSAGTSEWALKWLKEIAKDMRSVEETLAGMRTRNERLSSYLPTLTTLKAEFEMQLAVKNREYIKDNPKPERGVTAHKESMELHNAELISFYKMLVALHEDICTRISTSQSNIKSETNEMLSHG